MGVAFPVGRWLPLQRPNNWSGLGQGSDRRFVSPQGLGEFIEPSLFILSYYFLEVQGVLLNA